jgi:LPS-assembly lipoprotein
MSLRTSRKAALAAVLVLVGASLSGCGFTPLYATPGVTKGLSSVDVIAPDGRTGYLIREHLDDALVKDRGASPVWRMSLQLAEQRYPRGLRVDNVATRYEYVLVASYSLIDIASGAEAKRGRVRVQLTYDSADQPYASIAAQQDVADRAAEEVARRIQLELAAWLATRAKG